MSLKDKISEDLKTAMLSKDATRIDTLRNIRSEILKMDKSGMNREMTPDEEIQLLSRLAKQRRESIDMFQQANRTDLVEKEASQLKIIEEFLPKQMSDEEITQVIERIVSETGAASASDFSKVMPLVMKELKGKADGKKIQEIVKSKLS